jgi:hypothetical protein
MLIKLPIILDNKIVFTLFKLIKYDTYYLLSLFENINNYNINCDVMSDKNKPESDIININKSEINKSEGNIIKIIISNNITGYEYYNIYTPLKLITINNELITFYFFMTSFSLSINNNFDFFNCLNIILKDKLQMQLIEKTNYIKYQNNIFDIINSEYLILNNNKKYNKEFWEIINLLLNSSLFVFFLNKQKIINNKLIKKIQTIPNILKNIKYSIDYSNEYTFNDHIMNKENNKIELKDIIVNDFYYLLINDKKYLLVKIENKENNLIKLYNFNYLIQFNKYNWYRYSPETKINENKIYFYLFFNNNILYNLISKYNTKIKPLLINNIISYFLNDQIKSNLISFILENNNNNEELAYINIIKSNSYTSDFFKLTCTVFQSKFILILDALFCNYTYPIKYNKKELDPIFDNILYISLLNLDKILNSSEKDSNKLFISQSINIPNKLKLLYFNILKTFHQIINVNKETVKYIYDPLHVQFIKTFLFSNSLTLELLKSKISIDEFNNFKSNLLIHFTVHDIVKRITWNNINKKLHYIKYLLNHKDNLYFYDKLNKNIFDDNFDNRIKNIIINPLNMFKYLRKECDFIKWTQFLENKYNDLYFNAISISSDDFNILGKIIFCLLNIKEQNLNDKHYKKLIYYGINYPKMIIENNRINLKIKENFGYLKCNINLGILAKHLVQNKDNYIEFDDNEKNEIDVLKQKIDIVTNKYLKYKKKYYNIKNNEQKI